MLGLGGEAVELRAERVRRARCSGLVGDLEESEDRSPHHSLTEVILELLTSAATARGTREKKEN